MRQVVRNTFVKGMNQDNAYAVTSSDSFFFGLNGRLTTDSMGLSSMSFGSIKGNKKDYSLPDVGDS